MAKTNAATAIPAAPEAAPKTVDRSPNFPVITLETAIAKVKQVWDADKKNATSLAVLLTHLGYGEKKTGTSGRVVSALRQFGLLDYQGSGYRVSDLAFQILNKSNDAELVVLRRKSAKMPNIFREVLAHYKDGLPSDATFRDFLIFQKEFNPGSVERFISVFKSTLQFAKLMPGEYTSLDDGAPSVKVGDYVQWTSTGVDQFEVPRRVNSVSDDGLYAFVEGSHTGMPIGEVQKVDPQPAPPAPTVHSGASLIPPQNWMLNVPRGVRATLIITGADVRPEDLKRLKSQIDFLVDAFSDNDEGDKAKD